MTNLNEDLWDVAAKLRFVAFVSCSSDVNKVYVIQLQTDVAKNLLVPTFF